MIGCSQACITQTRVLNFKHHLRQMTVCILQSTVLFLLQDYLYKFTGKSRSILWGKGNPWRQKYFSITRVGNKPFLEFFNKKPKHRNSVPKGKHVFVQAVILVLVEILFPLGQEAIRKVYQVTTRVSSRNFFFFDRVMEPFQQKSCQLDNFFCQSE